MGAITKATAEAPCPLFTGRGLEQRGFTIKMPQKEYLSCVAENMAQEKAILGIYNYDLADRAYNDSTDVIAFQIYTYLGANAANVTTGRNVHAFDVWVQVDYDYSVATNLRNADVRAARLQASAQNNVSGVVHGAYICTQISGGYTVLGRYVEATSGYGTIAIEARSETIGSGTATAGDGTNYGVAGLVTVYKGSVALAGNYHAIALAIPYEGGAISGSSVGMYFFNQVILTGTAFDIGIDFGTSMVVKAINVDACSVFADADVTLTTADNAMEILVTSTGAIAANYIQALQLTVNHSTGAITGGGELHVLALDTSMTGAIACPYWYAQTIYMSQTGNPVASAVAAISIYLENLGTGIGNLMGIEIGINQSGGDPSGRFCFFRCRSHNATYMPKYVFMFEGANAAERFAYFEAGGASNMISAHSSGVTPEYNLKVYIEGVGEKFIKIYDAA